MNVYMYGGNKRDNATVSMIDKNQMAKVGQNYTMDYRTGVLLVAYPNIDTTT
jgi:hypothetical protein